MKFSLIAKIWFNHNSVDVSFLFGIFYLNFNLLTRSQTKKREKRKSKGNSAFQHIMEWEGIKGVRTAQLYMYYFMYDCRYNFFDWIMYLFKLLHCIGLILIMAVRNRRFIFLRLDTKVHAIRVHLFSLSIYLAYII